MLKSLAAALAAACLLAPMANAQTPPAPLSDIGPGRVGVFYPAANPGAPAVLVLGGSEGGHLGSGGLARALAAQGYAALGLGYFKEPGLPETLEEIPLEYFDGAIAWLQARPSAKGRRVILIGVSKGAEAALIVGGRNPQVCAVIAAAPSNVAWAGVNMQNLMKVRGSWSREGRPIPYAPYDNSVTFTSVLDYYTRSLAKTPAEAVIPVERIGGPVLLVSGRDDKLWPSTLMADAVMARLDKAGFRHPHTHLAYDGAGHGVFGTPIPQPLPANAATSPLLQLGGTVEGMVAARADVWPKTLAFLAEAGASPGCAMRR